MKIRVTKKDILYGIMGSCESCPVSIAATRAFKKPYSTGISMIFPAGLQDRNDNNIFGLPIKVQRFIADFDSDKEVKPFTFEVT